MVTTVILITVIAAVTIRKAIITRLNIHNTAMAYIKRNTAATAAKR
jgi:hypothetical protein